jgi:hypothetical protein
MRNLILGLGFVAAALMLMVATSIAGERVVLLDECDPATFNAALVADTCINAVGAPILGAPVTFTDFLAALSTGHPASSSGRGGTLELRMREAKCTPSPRSRSSGVASLPP